MVCEKCQKKLGKVITPDPWKSGARNTTEGGGRTVGMCILKIYNDVVLSAMAKLSVLCLEDNDVCY